MSARSATEIRQQSSETGGRTLEIFSNTPRLNEWLFSKLSAGVRGQVLEGGSGLGSMSRLLRGRATHLVVTDTEPRYLRELEAAFAGDEHVVVSPYDLDGPPPPAVAGRVYDAIVMVNVIEHIADDGALVARLASLLRPGGQLLVYVPACPFAFGSLDVALGHHRRYTPASLVALMRSGGLDPSEPRYVNLLGLAGWCFWGRLLDRKVLSPSAVALFERVVPFARLEDRFKLPIGLGLYTHAIKPG